MFKGLSETVLDKVYDWLTHTYYAPCPTWSKHITNERKRAIHALNDMRALFSGVGNNGWWDRDRVRHLDDLRDITPLSMDEVLMTNWQLDKYHRRRKKEQEACWLGDEEFDWDEFCQKYGPTVEKMQGNKDGKLYEYTKKLFWDSVEWFLENYATEKEMAEVREVVEG